MQKATSLFARPRNQRDYLFQCRVAALEVRETTVEASRVANCRASGHSAPADKAYMRPPLKESPRTVLLTWTDCAGTRYSSPGPKATYSSGPSLTTTHPPKTCWSARAATLGSSSPVKPLASSSWARTRPRGAISPRSHRGSPGSTRIPIRVKEGATSRSTDAFQELARRLTPQGGYVKYPQNSTKSVAMVSSETIEAPNAFRLPSRVKKDLSRSGA